MTHNVLGAPFATLAEWDEWTKANCPAPRDNDTAVLVDSGDRLATREELEAYLAEHKSRTKREGVGLERA